MGGRGSRFEGTVRLTDNEAWAINQYFSSDSYHINEKLYFHQQLDDYDKQLMDGIDKTLEKMPFVKNKTLVRDLSFLFTEQKESYIKQIKEGSIISNDAYWSATTKDEYQDIPDIRFVIRNAKKAKDMGKIEGKGESEVIYPRGSRFEVLSKKPLQKYGKHDIIVVELREL